MSLSEKIVSGQLCEVIDSADVKEFIKQLKERTNQYNDLGQFHTGEYIHELIDELVGPDLI